MAHPVRKPILISGAGLASLLLAQALRKASIPFSIYERDASLSFRAQGYRLRLSTEGLDAIESVLDKDHFARFWDACGKTGGSGSVALDAISGEKTNIELPQAGSNGAKRPNLTLTSRDGKIVGISRGDMRKIFLSGCEDCIHWNHHVTGYELTGSGVRVVFSDGSKSEEGDMLIGGEGIKSEVAKQVSNGALKVFDTGARGIHGQAPAKQFQALGEGVWMMLDRSRAVGSVFTITNVRDGFMNDPDVKLGWTMGANPGIIKAPNNDDATIGKPAADIAKSITANWSERLKPLFENMDEAEAAFWKITCSTPTGVPEWKNEPRVTVIGDAVHSMTPAGGIGANTAVRDSALLGKLLAEAGGYAESVTAAYEKQMRVYASEAVGTSFGLGKAQWGIHIDENTPTV
ncbi:hypothetical protein ANO11243_017770 [Dothideomycetidae sp. 11243]|nr:hypothetical protein ANO11243_017770 [fungal sp. No.11243]